jgi:restriction system protein
MAEITIQRTGGHIRKLFEILSSHPDGLQAAEALKKLATVVEMTPYEAGLYESTGTRRFEKIVRFVTVDCVKAGWLLKTKGVWSITDVGKKAMVAYPNPEAFYREAIRLYRAWKQSSTNAQDAESLEELSSAETATAEASVTFEQAEEQAWNEIEAYLLPNTGSVRRFPNSRHDVPAHQR